MASKMTQQCNQWKMVVEDRDDGTLVVKLTNLDGETIELEPVKGNGDGSSLTLRIVTKQGSTAKQSGKQKRGFFGW